jgi:HK97 family phage portal protein
MGFMADMIERRFGSSSGGTLAEPDRSILEAFGVSMSTSGIAVTEKKAEGLPAVYGCVDVISSMEAWLPLKVMKDVDGGGREPATDHPLYTVLHDLANPIMTAYDFRSVMGRWKLLWGSAYAEVQRDRQNRIVALWPLRTDRMEAPRTNGQNHLVFRYRMESGATKDYVLSDPDNPPLLRLMINSLDGIVGRSPIRVLMDSLGVSLAARDYGAYIFANKGIPSGVLKFKTPLKKEQKDENRKNWNAVHGGVANAGRTAVLEGDVDYTPIGIPPHEAQFIELMKFQLEEVSGRIYRVPGFLLGHTEKSTSWGTGIEQQMRGFLTVTMMPHLTSWEQAISRDLLSRKSFRSHKATFITNALVKPDLLQLSQALKVQIEGGLMSPNEGRGLVDLPKRTDKEGDAYWRPANMASTAQPDTLTPSSAPAQGADDAA